MSPQELVNNLRSFLPLEAVLYETEDLKPYECDGLSAYRQLPLVVVLPRTEEQIIKVLQLCFATKTPVVARGGGAHRTAAPGFPITGLHHQLASAFDGKVNAVQLGKLFVSQRRPKVTVVCANELDYGRAEGFSQPPIRFSAALLAD